MAYRKPEEVVAPRSRWKFGRTLCNTGQQGWSAAEGLWDKEPAVGIRWNGDDDSGSPGSPQSHGQPTWFIVPKELEQAVREFANDLETTNGFVTCTISKPEDFEFGVYRIHVEIVGSLRDRIAKSEISFEIPQLQDRFFRPEKGFLAPPPEDKMPPYGKLVGGEWRCIVQTNGISEENNSTKIDIVRDRVVANILNAIKPFSATTPYSQTTTHSVD